MNKNLSIAAALGAIAVIIGAFASHSLEQRLSEQALNSIETAVRYQLYHVFAILIIGIYKGFTQKEKQRIHLAFLLGIAFFSGSIYSIYLLGIPTKFVWFITPIGGLFLISGWILMSISFLKRK